MFKKLISRFRAKKNEAARNRGWQVPDSVRQTYLRKGKLVTHYLVNPVKSRRAQRHMD